MVYTFQYALILWFNGGGRGVHGYGTCMVKRNAYLILVTIENITYVYMGATGGLECVWEHSLQFPALQK